MTSHASKKTKHFLPRLRNPFLILTIPKVALCQPSLSLLQAQRILPHKMRATREKSHSQMGGPTSRWLWKNLRVWDPKSAHPTWQNLPGRKAFFARVSTECHEEISLNIPSRRNCIPKGVTSSQICLLDSNTPPPKASPLLSCLLRKERPARVKHGAALEHSVFCSFLSQGFPSPHFLLCSSLMSLTSFHDTRKARLHTTLPVHLEPECKESRKWSLAQGAGSNGCY